ncbi:MAG: tetratricopeptide repeat protein [Flavobacteriales bacterium]|nr:tetratricopeptide repeat protein [Flavobacteriales bacterium]
MSKKTSNDTGTQDMDLGEVYSRTELFLDRNKKAITYGATGLVVVVALLLGYRKFIAEPRAQEASELMWKAEYYFEVDSLDKALDGDDQWPGFQAIASDYGGTPAGKLAHYYLGSIYMQKGEYDLAVDHYQKAKVKDDVLRALAVAAIGDAYVELGREADAVKQFEKAAGMHRNEFTTPLFLMKAGLIHQRAGDHRAAAKAFRRIASEFPNSSEANQARKYAGRSEALGG